MCLFIHLHSSADYTFSKAGHCTWHHKVPSRSLPSWLFNALQRVEPLPWRISRNEHARWRQLPPLLAARPLWAKSWIFCQDVTETGILFFHLFRNTANFTALLQIKNGSLRLRCRTHILNFSIIDFDRFKCKHSMVMLSWLKHQYTRTTSTTWCAMLYDTGGSLWAVLQLHWPK